MRYVVSVGKVEHLFDADELGFNKARKFAQASKSMVHLEGEIWDVPRRMFTTVRKEIVTEPKYGI